MSTLSDLGLPEPAAAGASSDTLAALGLPEPRPRLTIPDFLSRDFRNPFPRTAAGARFDPFSPEAIAQRDAPIVPEYPLEAAASVLPGIRAAQAVAGPLKSLPWLVRSATTGAAAGATGGAIAESGRGPGAAARGAGAGALAGAVLSPPLEAAVGAIASRLAPRAPVPASAPVSPVEPTSAPPVASEPVAPVSPPAGGPVSVKAVPVPGEATTVNAQQFPAIDAEAIKRDPAFLERLKALGGGRVVSNEETLAKAWNAGPMDPEELAAWPADSPIDPVTQTRGLLTFDYFQQQRAQAIASGDLAAAARANETVARLLPGVTNLRATAGRTTQAQAMFVQDEMSKILDTLADMQAKGVPFDQVTRRANEMLRASKQAARTKGALAEWRDALSALETAATWAKLTSPVTHAINFTSNALNAAIVRPIEQAVRSGAYLAQGNRPAAEAELQAVFGTRMGFVSGMKRWAAAIMDDAEQGALAGEYDRNIPLPKAARPFDVFRQLSGADAFWKGILEDSRIYQLAYRSAREQGLSGRALAARIEELRLSPPASWKTEAAEYAREYTFQMDPDTFLKKIQGIGNLPGMKFVLPFTKTPYNLQKFYMQRSPYGLASRRNIGGLMAGGQEQAEAAGRLGAGIALSAGALALVSSTDATGAYPTDPRERARWQAEGIKEYSLRLPDGRYLQYSRFSPLGQYIGQAVALRDALASGRPEAQALASGMLAATMRQTLDLPFMSSLKDLLDAVTGASEPTGSQKRAPERFGTGIVTGFVPNVLRDVRVQADPVMRETRGVAQGVQNMIPGQSQRLPASIDVLGRERTYEPDRLTRGLKVLSTRRETPETRLLAEVGWNPSNPNPSLTMKDGSKRTLEGAELERFRREMGEATVRALAPFVRNREALLKLDRDTQVERLEDAVNRERKKVRKKWATNR